MKHKLYTLRKNCYDTYNGTRSLASKLYDGLMTLGILLSLAPLTLKGADRIFTTTDLVVAILFGLDYLLRFINADLRLKKGWRSYLLYPFTPMALVDLLSLLSLLPLHFLSHLPRLLVRLLRLGRICRVFKLLRYCRSLHIIGDVIKAQSKPLLAVASLAIGYILLSALAIFNAEPDTFANYFEAVYWAAISLTTIGYGDFHPLTDTGRLIAIISALLGVAVVALPAGIITAGYLDALQKKHKKD